MKSKASSTKWLAPAALVLLSVIPLIFGTLRLLELIGGAEITPANARFFASPAPVVVHIVCAAFFAILGVFQFVNSFRQRHPVWHRVVGRVLVGCGLLIGLSGLWMTLFYPHVAGTTDLLYVFRLVFGLGMVVSIILGFVTIRQGNVIAHRAWMMRGYAIGLGAGTQVLMGMVGAILFGSPNALTHDLLMGAAWVINLAIAEWVIRRRRAPRVRRATAIVSHS